MATGKVLAHIVNYGLDDTDLSFDVEVSVLNGSGLTNTANVPDETLLPAAILVASSAGRNAIHDAIAKGVVSQLAASPYSVSGLSYKEVIVTGYSGRGANGGSFVTQSCVLVGSRTTITNRNGGGAAVGIADSTISSDLPDDTVVRFVAYYDEVRNNVSLVLRFAAIKRSDGKPYYLNGSELTLNATNTITRKSTSITLSSFGAADQVAIRNAQGFYVYTKNVSTAKKTDTAVIYYAAVAFDLPE
jgi:hypothetical protein